MVLGMMALSRQMLHDLNFVFDRLYRVFAAKLLTLEANHERLEAVWKEKRSIHDGSMRHHEAIYWAKQKAREAGLTMRRNRWRCKQLSSAQRQAELHLKVENNLAKGHYSLMVGA